VHLTLDEVVFRLLGCSTHHRDPPEAGEKWLSAYFEQREALNSAGISGFFVAPRKYIALIPESLNKALVSNNS